MKTSEQARTQLTMPKTEMELAKVKRRKMGRRILGNQQKWEEAEEEEEWQDLVEWEEKEEWEERAE
jgi:hypothetical protein